MKTELKLKEALECIAEDVGNVVILLDGDLGAGKTYFARSLIRHILRIDEIVNSPTFGIVISYQNTKTIINHFDLYRVRNIEELDAIGFDGYFVNNESAIRNINIIEWWNVLGKKLERISKNMKVLRIGIGNANGEYIYNIETF